MIDPNHQFLGWFRAGKGHRWEAVVSGETHSACEDKILFYRRDGVSMADKAVLPAGVDPNVRAAGH